MNTLRSSQSWRSQPDLGISSLGQGQSKSRGSAAVDRAARSALPQAQSQHTVTSREALAFRPGLPGAQGLNNE